MVTFNYTLIPFKNLGAQKIVLLILSLQSSLSIWRQTPKNDLNPFVFSKTESTMAAFLPHQDTHQ